MGKTWELVEKREKERGDIERKCWRLLSRGNGGEVEREAEKEQTRVFVGSYPAPSHSGGGSPELL